MVPGFPNAGVVSSPHRASSGGLHRIPRVARNIDAVMPIAGSNAGFSLKTTQGDLPHALVSAEMCRICDRLSRACLSFFPYCLGATVSLSLRGIYIALSRPGAAVTATIPQGNGLFEREI